MKRFIVNIDNKSRLSETIANFVSFMDVSEPMEVTIKPYKKNRSLEQNAYYWTLLKHIGEATGFTKDDLHDMLLYKFVGLHKKMVGDVEVSYIPSTTKMKVGEFSDHIIQIEAWSANLGIALPARDL